MSETQIGRTGRVVQRFLFVFRSQLEMSVLPGILGLGSEACMHGHVSHTGKDKCCPCGASYGRFRHGNPPQAYNLQAFRSLPSTSNCNVRAHGPQLLNHVIALADYQWPIFRWYPIASRPYAHFRAEPGQTCESSCGIGVTSERYVCRNRIFAKEYSLTHTLVII